ncbi:MAG: 50S ribosomal protein L4 [Schleiferiaceae bacterium]|jgi:large subunit ribosomal protein L4|nr:50S ribosomal protein L4 [Schleiferiaceae bacterium]MDP4759196.1 50S ribosomal protein L4 [Schleiferiaceae bacterium]MDP4768219.1 50S ribosomal protein L4 [Schleiferiaceae bacterium]MDP4878145.1 50S ribosomal protein L4 [Schleiferiaceae bacterium]MDP4959555.1 50S ribosomal protein L4 [Schleiferiaceae bacterium]
MELKVLDINGKETKNSVTLDASVFGIEPNDHSIYLDVKQFLANARQGTHKSKERAEVNRTTKKHHKQKGTGGARAGSLKSPVQRGGGTVFGPRPRNYGFKLNKKVKQLARKSALSMKVKSENLKVVENFTFEVPKTTSFINVMTALGLDKKKSLFIVGDYDKNLYLSSRNLQGVKVVNSSEISTYDIMNASEVVLSVGAVEKITAILS